MANIFDRLRLAHHEGIFQTREEAYAYVMNFQSSGSYPEITDPSKVRPTVVAEPTVLLYESGDEFKGPNVILAIGSVGDGTPNTGNRTFFIDTKKTEEELEALEIKVDELINKFNITAADSDTIDLSAESTDNGFVISGDVKISDFEVVNDKIQRNIIKSTNKGIYAFVDMEYDEESATLKFIVNDNIVKEFGLTKDQHVVKGWYNENKEAIQLKLADNTIIDIDVVKLIDEWTVPSVEEQSTPIILSKEHVSGYSGSHQGIYGWQDILTADVRVADHIRDNIIQKDGTGRYLYVKGTADNIKYNDEYTVKQAIDNVETKISSSNGNIILKRNDGIYAHAMLDYNALENKILFTYTDTETQNTKTVEYALNSVRILEDMSYDPVNETIVIRYIDAQGEYKRLEVPVSGIIEEWDVNNNSHNVYLNKYRSSGQGKDILSADVKIHEGDNNILVDKNHELYVNGVASNIKLDVTGSTTVKETIDSLKDAQNTISGAVEAEVIRATNEETRIENKFDEEIGEGFDSRNTVRDEIDAEKAAREAADEAISSSIETLSANTEGRLKSIVNNDRSINVDNTDAVSPVIKVNLSTEVLDEKENIIKLNADGLYAGVDLKYEFNEQVGTNQLIFSTTNGTKVFDLKTNSVVDKIYYDPIREAIIVEYTINGVRQPDVVIPVGDLINEWRIWDGHEGAVQLEKQRIASGTSEQDVLKAAVVISSAHTDNILINDSGALYVSGKGITDNANAIAALNERVSTAEENISSANDEIERLDRAIQDEASRLDNSYSDLTRSISSEVARATAVEDTLRTNLSDEVARSVAKDTEFENKINNEITRSTEKDNELASAINNETVRATSAETAINTTIELEKIARENEDSRIEHKLDDEISRSTAKDEELANNLANAIDDINSRIDSEKLGVDNTASVNLAINDNNDIVANVNVSGKDANIVKIVSDTAEGTGIFATVDLNYDAATNKLTLKTTNGEKELALSAGSIIKSIEYDPVGKNIIIKYERTSGGETQEMTVTVPVEDLFNDWTVQEGQHLGAIILHKEEGSGSTPDILSAEIVISTLEDNILINDQGSLYVSGKGISDNKAAIEALDARMSSAEDGISTIKTNLNNEISRATSAEDNIARDLADEVNRATTVENRLSELINNEIDRSVAKDTALETKIDNEIVRSTDKDNELNTALTAETVRATSAETALNTAIENLSTKVDNEISRATNKEDALDAKIDEKVAELNEKIDNKALDVKDTVTVDMEVDENNKISSNVIISTKNSNIIKAVSDTADGTGIFASVDLDYNAATNKLTLRTSTTEKEIALNVGSIIKSIEYDDDTKSLIVKYDTMSGGQAIEQTIIVPVATLFNDWIVQEGQHLGAIILNKENGEGGNPDILSAEVVISTLADNMLVNDQGSLYVSSKPIDDLSAAVETFKEEYEESLNTTETPTLKLYRDAQKHLMGDVKISTDAANLIKVDNINEGLMFNGNIDCGEY